MALREIVADLVVRVRGARQLNDVQRSTTSMVRNMRGAAQALGGFAAAVSSALAVREIAAVVEEVIDLGDETAKTARQLGISADELSRWRFAAERSGVDAGQLTNGFRRLQRNIVDASEGSSTAVRAFRDLGVSATDGSGRVREMEDILPELADAFGRLETDTQRSARAQQLFGRAGAQLLPFFDEGSAGLERLRARFDELGGTMGGEFYANAEAAQDALADWDVAMTSLRSGVVVSVLPAVTGLVSTLAEFVAGAREVLSRSSAMDVALGALTVAAIALAAALAPVVLGTLALMLPLAAVFLLVEDLVTMFRGGESAIGDFLDAMFGAGTAQSVVENLTAAWEGLYEIIQGVARVVRGEEFADRGGTSDVAAGRDLAQRSAARSGRVSVRRGESRDQALARTNRIRAEEGLDPVAAPWGGTGAPPSVFGVDAARLAAMAETTPTRAVASGSVRAGGGRGDVHQAIDARAQITIEGGDPEATARALERRRGSGLARAIHQAAARVPAAGEA